MKTKMKTLLLIQVLVLMAFHTNAEKPRHTQPDHTALNAAGFKLVEKRDGIALYERWFLYDSALKAREIKLVFDVKTNLQSALNLLRDEHSSNKWNEHTSKFQIITESSDQWTNYIRYDLPWPMGDHDCVLKFYLDKPCESKYLINFESGSHKSFPVSPAVSRLSNIKGTWKLEQQNQSIHIEYSVTTMPSSSLPRWVTDPIIRNNLLSMMVKFSNLLETINN